MMGSRIALADDESATGWFHVLMDGTWEGHPNGAFSIDEDTIDAMIARFSKQRTPMMVDWNHRSLEAATEDDGKAAGFVTKLEKRAAEDGDGFELWAFAEWNDRAAKLIRSGEYRYCSPVIDWEAEDRKTGVVGVELFNIALTNQPFLDGQHAIRLHRVSLTGGQKMATKPKTKLADKPAEATDEDEKKAAMADGQEEPGAPPDNTADAVAAMQLLAETTGLGSAELIKMLIANADKIGKMLVGAEGPAEMSAVLDAVTAELEDARSELTALKSDPKHAGKSAEQEIEEMIACGRVKESRKSAALALLKSDRAMFSRVWPEGSREAPIGGQTTSTAKRSDGDSPVVARLSALTAPQRATYEYMAKMSRGGRLLYTAEQALEKTLKHTSKDQPTA